MIGRISLSILAIACLYSCKSVKNIASETSSSTAETVVVPAHDSVIFLVFKISEDSMTGKSTVTLTSKQKTAGKMKKAGLEQKSYHETIVVELYDQNTLISSATEQHPLYKHAEYEENGKLARKLIKLGEAEFFVRLPYKGRPDKIKVSEIIGKAPKKELATIKI